MFDSISLKQTKDDGVKSDVRVDLTCGTFPRGCRHQILGDEFMKSLFLTFAIVIAGSAAQAQAVLPPLPEITNLEDFSLRSGTLIQREFTRVGEFATPFRVDVVKVTDVLGKNSLYGVRISGNVAQGAPRDAAFLDADEVDGFVKVIDLMKAIAFSTTPDNFTDLAYRTRGGLSIGAIYANRRWSAAMRLDRFDPKTAISLDATDFETLRALLVKAKESLH